jgi:hypothetical protein
VCNALAKKPTSDEQPVSVIEKVGPSTDLGTIAIASTQPSTTKPPGQPLFSPPPQIFTSCSFNNCTFQIIPAPIPPAPATEEFTRLEIQDDVIEL